MNVIVGLGNPGQTYHDTRHNVGFAVIQTLATRHDVKLVNRVLGKGDGRPASIYGEYQAVGGHAVRLVMPLTMMNESGEVLKTLEMPTSQVLVVCDDVNVPLGTIRLRPQGSAGGHHGLQSCLDVLGTEQISRLRLGVGIDPLPSDLRDFVLSPFRSTERPLAKRMVEQAADACETWVVDGIEVAMNRFNRSQEVVG